MDSLKMLRTVGKNHGKQKDVSHSFNPLFQPAHNAHQLYRGYESRYSTRRGKPLQVVIKNSISTFLLITKWGTGGERSDNPVKPRSGLEVQSQRSRRERSERTERVCGAIATSFSFSKKQDKYPTKC
jgi:hypothetical protein